MAGPPKRAAAIVAEHLNRQELERAPSAGEEEEEDSDYQSEEDDTAATSKKRKLIHVARGEGFEPSRLSSDSKRRALEIYNALTAALGVSSESEPRARSIIRALIKEEAEEDPEHPRFKRKRNESWVDPMLNNCLKLSVVPPAESIASEIVKDVITHFGTTDVKETVRFAGETMAVARKVDKRVAAVEEAMEQQKSGLDEMLQGISKKRGITTVEKSSYDWEKYKEEKKLGDELKDASKAGFVEKQAFLNRVDDRQFEKEKAVRERERAQRDAAASKKE